MSKKVLLINCYDSRNKGDAAIVVGTVRALRSIDSSVSIKIVTLAPDIDRVFYKDCGVDVIAAPTVGMKGPKIISFLLIALTVILGSSWVRWTGRLPRRLIPFNSVRVFLQCISEADVVVSCGGGYWQDSWGYGFLIHLLQLIGAIRSGKPVMALGISVGPFVTTFYRWLVRHWLNKYKLVVVREAVSLEVLRDLRVFKPEIRLGADMAFALLMSENDGGKLRPVQIQNVVESDSVRIGVTVREWVFPGYRDRQVMQRKYEEAIANALDCLVKKLNARVYFLPQVTAEPHDDDRKVAKRVSSLMQESDRSVVVKDDLSIPDLLSLIASMDLVIATRFHSAILSFLVGVPVVAIEYEHKTSGIMKQMGLEDWVLRIDNVNSDEIVARCIALWQKRDRIKGYIRKKVEELSNIALESSKLVWCMSKHKF